MPPENYENKSMNLVRLQDTKLTHRNLLHSYTLREIKETIPFTIVTKRIKYIGINLPKDAKEIGRASCRERV